MTELCRTIEYVIMNVHDTWLCEQVFVEPDGADGALMYSDAGRTYCDMHEGHCVARPMKPLRVVPSNTAFLAASDTWLVLLKEVLGRPCMHGRVTWAHVRHEPLQGLTEHCS